MKKLCLLLLLCVGIPAYAATPHSVALSWVSSTSAGVTGYNVYRGTTPKGENYSAPINGTTPIPGVTFVDTAVVAKGTYYYTVEAVCPTCSPDSSVPSNEVSVTVPGDPQPLPPVMNTPTSQ